MLINTIELKDFRQFRGNGNKLHFSIDPTQNVTVISGDNGTGKSTISQSFSWCLFAETNYSTDVLCLATQDEMNVGDECTVIVKLNLIHANIEYTISRSQIFTKENPSKLKKSRTMPVIFYKSSDGQMKEVKGNNDVQNTLKTIIPSELSKYFFFDGERIEKMKEEIKKGRNIEFVNAVKIFSVWIPSHTPWITLRAKGKGIKPRFFVPIMKAITLTVKKKWIRIISLSVNLKIKKWQKNKKSYKTKRNLTSLEQRELP